MAHFAELDDNNIVKRVVKVGNDISTAAGPLGENNMHVDGEKWCEDFFKGGNWKQTSYSGAFRKTFAGRNFTYDPVNDVFIAPKPADGFTLDSNFDWQPPVAKPTTLPPDSEGKQVLSDPNDPNSGVGDYWSVYWNVDEGWWEAKDGTTPPNLRKWDTNTSSWTTIS